MESPKNLVLPEGAASEWRPETKTLAITKLNLSLDQPWTLVLYNWLERGLQKKKKNHCEKMNKKNQINKIQFIDIFPVENHPSFFI